MFRDDGGFFGGVRCGLMLLPRAVVAVPSIDDQLGDETEDEAGPARGQPSADCAKHRLAPAWC